MVTICATVRLWDDEERWGVVDAPEVPGGCWTHFAAIEMPGYRTLGVGEVVRVKRWSKTATPTALSGVGRPADRPAVVTGELVADGATAAHQSTLMITFDRLARTQGTPVVRLWCGTLPGSLTPGWCGLQEMVNSRVR